MRTERSFSFICVLAAKLASSAGERAVLALTATWLWVRMYLVSDKSLNYLLLKTCVSKHPFSSVFNHPNFSHVFRMVPNFLKSDAFRFYPDNTIATSLFSIIFYFLFRVTLIEQNQSHCLYKHL